MKAAPNKKKAAVFLDRDGTINRESDYLLKPEQLRLLPNAAKAIKAINAMGFLAIIITNQGGIARGLLSPETLDEIHALLIERLGKKSAHIDAIYYCPHHPEGTLEKYEKKCRCRKPEPGMILDAAKKYGIDLKKSVMIGDRTMDILAGKRAGAATILLKTGSGGKDGKYEVTPDYTAKDLFAAVAIVKKIKNRNG